MIPYWIKLTPDRILFPTQIRNNNWRNLSKIAYIVQTRSLVIIIFFDCNWIQSLYYQIFSQNLAPNLLNLLNPNHVLNTMISTTNSKTDLFEYPNHDSIYFYARFHWENIKQYSLNSFRPKFYRYFYTLLITNCKFLITTVPPNIFI